MDKELQIIKEIQEKKNLIKKTKDEIFSLEFELHKIEKEKVLKKFKIGDIIVRKDIYIFLSLQTLMLVLVMQEQIRLYHLK